ncbi:hypothetical protein NC652_006254 [Populus alba x Populus x berolinensis]|nr:hypothetical protein NC652_006254 [Populus alba x Populus x berolinensis]
MCAFPALKTYRLSKPSSLFLFHSTIPTPTPTALTPQSEAGLYGFSTSSSSSFFTLCDVT